MGFLSGVGVSLLSGQLPDMLGVPGASRFPANLAAVITRIGQAHWPTVMMAGTVIAVIWVLERVAKHLPGSLIAITAAISPYREIQDPNPEVRASLRELIDRARESRRAAYIYVNNRLEGNAPATIMGIVDQRY